MSFPLPTVGEIARLHNVSISKIEYVIRSRRIIPSAHAGNARVFSQEDVRFIGSELNKIRGEESTTLPVMEFEGRLPDEFLDNLAEQVSIAGNDDCELCGKHSAEHFVSTKWGDRHCCTACAEDVQLGDDS